MKRKTGMRRIAAYLLALVFMLAFLPAAGAVTAFLLLEDLNNKMVLIDNRTIMMAAILMAQIAAALLAKRRCTEYN